MNTSPGRFSRRSFALGGTAAAMLATSGCIGADDGGGVGADGEEFAGTVEWWTINLQKNFSEYIDQLISDYTAEHPDVTIKWVDVPGQDIDTKLLAALASDNVPDAVNINSASIGQYKAAMSDLNDHFTGDELGTYQQTLLDPLQSADGKQVALPWYNGGADLGMYRNSALDQVGFDPENPPQTWDEALGLAESVWETTGSYGANMMAYSMTVQSEGVPMLTEDHTEAAFNTDRCLEILEKFKLAYDSGAIAPGVLGKDERQYEQTLVNKQIAFFPSRTSTHLKGIEENAPEVYEDLTIAPAVTGPDGIQYMQAQQVFGIPAKSTNKAAAAAWLRWVTESSNLLEFCKLAAIFPSTPESLEDPYFTDIDTSTPAGMGKKILVDTFSSIKDGSLNTQNDQHLRNLFDEEVRAFASGSKSAEDALAAAEEQWNANLSQWTASQSKQQ